MKIFTKEQVESSTSSSNLLIIIENNVYDVTKFSKVHPGGECNNIN